MDTGVVYERKYPKVDAEALYREMEEQASDETGQPSTFNEIMAKIYSNTAYVIMPQREQECEAFIEVAIEVSELYEIDCKITNHFDHVTVNYSFDCAGNMRELKRVFSLADDYSFFAGIYDRDITVCLDYYTHAVVRNGRVIFP